MLTQDNRSGESNDTTQDKFQKLARLLESTGETAPLPAVGSEKETPERACTIYVMGNNNQVMANSHHNFSALKRLGRFLPLLVLILFFFRTLPAKI